MRILIVFLFLLPLCSSAQIYIQKTVYDEVVYCEDEGEVQDNSTGERIIVDGSSTHINLEMVKDEGEFWLVKDSKGDLYEVWGVEYYGVDGWEISPHDNPNLPTITIIKIDICTEFP